MNTLCTMCVVSFAFLVVNLFEFVLTFRLGGLRGEMGGWAPVGRAIGFGVYRLEFVGEYRTRPGSRFAFFGFIGHLPSFLPLSRARA